ncbi:MraY family glycosyltransferase [Paraburkholderia rhizosphaerae]|uniref:UDP-N-acetylmuramyl pentapeptide phosphotransferase/UDP-N-acetylglucosamine-1-phosphate transferase n=1 Tax=Paraburkholderia rhizosphaerae TaxID=480658 RepID=A0A4R8L565_9BURK|nr:glycosyltransferase family 4 protein [Paraburkholderia rhizosphaerae]TDY37138.1 UDP-N-acetylmuramyl pentapeptide phosphotransferase/UDP-N-acetylglucosamine-1-phosphate transferase [Paraburkholderia rhizosphaerae]
MHTASPFALIAIAALAALLSFGILVALLRTGWAWKIAIDIPNQRSLHTRPVPRIGGWGVLPASLLLIAFEAPALRAFAAGAVLLGVVSLIDDRRGLPARVRFAAHILVAAAAVALASVDISWWLAAAAVIAIVWLVNLFNFMDGSNGLAGGMAVFGFGTYAVAAVPAQPQLALAAAVIAGAAFGFLILNFKPARIFLGDVGSVPLGFFSGALGFWGWQHGAWPIWFPALAFAPFIADSTVTLLRRLARGEKVWEAHREHYYQRLVRLNGTHVQVALLYYWLMLVGSSIALMALNLPEVLQWVMVAVWYGVLALVGWTIDRRWQGFMRAQRDSGGS